MSNIEQEEAEGQLKKRKVKKSSINERGSGRKKRPRKVNKRINGSRESKSKSSVVRIILA